MNNALSKNKGGSTVFEIIIAITLITFILFFPVIAFSLMHKKNLLADTLALGLQTVSVEGGLTDRTEHVLLENLSAKGLLPTSPTHPLRQRIRFESNADARGGQTQNLVYKDGPAPKISFTIWYPADTEVSFINRLSRLIGVNNQGAAFQTNVAGETVWYYRMGGYIFSEKIENGTMAALPPPSPLIVLPDAIITMNPLTDILPTTNITFTHNAESNGVAITGVEWQVNSETVVTTSSLNRTFPAGNHVVRLRVQNTEGVWSNWAFQTFAVQSIPDAVITMTPNTSITTATNVIFTHNATSNGVAITSVEWQRNSDAITTTPPNGIFTIGNHVVRLRVRNAMGAWSSWVQVEFSVEGHSFTMIESGGDFSIAKGRDGIAWAWGSNSHGQLGDETAIQKSTPVEIHGSRSAIALAAGERDFIILLRNGTVWTERRRYEGWFTPTITRGALVQVRELTDAVAISGGARFSLAVKNDGAVWGWGENTVGQLGRYTEQVGASAPIQIAGATDVISAVAGASHTLAIRRDGTVIAWGNNANGQLGIGTFLQRYGVHQVHGLTDIVAVSGGSTHSLALRNDGIVWSWGQNWHGVLGNGSTDWFGNASPQQINNLTGIISITSGRHHSLALRSDGTVWAWGNNWWGQLGDGTVSDRRAPVQVSGLTGIIAISAGNRHSFALKNDGTLWAWGANEAGQLGNGSTINSSIPILISSPLE